MKIKFIPFSQKADLLIADSTQRSNIIVSALALAISNLSHIPTSETADIASHFNLQLLPGIKQTISEWNESMVFDTRACIEQARMFWTIRYTAAYPISRPLYSVNCDFFKTLIGVNTYVPPELDIFLEAYKTEVLMLSLLAANIILDSEN